MGQVDGELLSRSERHLSRAGSTPSALPAQLVKGDCLLTQSQQLKHLKEALFLTVVSGTPPCSMPCPAPGLRPRLGGSPWLSKKRSQMISKNNSKATGRQSQNTRKENVSSFTSGTRGYFMVRVWLGRASRGCPGDLAGRATLCSQPNCD